MVEDVWNRYGTRLELVPSLEWWKMSETATTALGRNHYQVWNDERRLKLLRHLVGTTTKCRRCLGLLRDLVGTITRYGMVEDV